MNKIRRFHEKHYVVAILCFALGLFFAWEVSEYCAYTNGKYIHWRYGECIPGQTKEYWGIGTCQSWCLDSVSIRKVRRSLPFSNEDCERNPEFHTFPDWVDFHTAQRIVERDNATTTRIWRRDRAGWPLYTVQRTYIILPRGKAEILEGKWRPPSKGGQTLPNRIQPEPLWGRLLFLGLVFALPVFGMYLTIRTLLERRVAGRRASENCCTGCGYSLTANTSGICPECGSSISD